MDDDSVVKTFNWHDLPEHPAVLFASMRRSGKTHMLGHILHALHRNEKFAWDVCLLFSETSTVQNSFRYIPKGFHYPKLENDVITNMLTKQQESIDRWRKFGKPPNRRPARVLVILDDVISSKQLYYSPPLISLFTQGRHSHVSIFLLSQSLVGAVPPNIRSNCDMLCFWRQPSFNYRKDIVDNYLTMQRDKKIAHAFMDKVWDKPYKCLCIFVSQSQHAVRLTDFCYSYLAPEEEPPSFRLGHGMFWSKPTKEKSSVNSKDYTIETS